MAPSPRIASSAIASRSAVVMPGATAALSFSSVRPTTSPAWRISAISASDLIWIIGGSSSKRAEGGDGPVGYIIHRAHGVDADQDARLGVVPDERRGLLVVDLQ